MVAVLKKGSYQVTSGYCRYKLGRHPFVHSISTLGPVSLVSFLVTPIERNVGT